VNQKVRVILNAADLAEQTVPLFFALRLVRSAQGHG
jgi:hypothetical protein